MRDPAAAALTDLSRGRSHGHENHAQAGQAHRCAGGCGVGSGPGHGHDPRACRPTRFAASSAATVGLDLTDAPRRSATG